MADVMQRADLRMREFRNSFRLWDMPGPSLGPGHHADRIQAHELDGSS
jgi:hypothetical protein